MYKINNILIKTLQIIFFLFFWGFGSGYFCICKNGFAMKRFIRSTSTSVFLFCMWVLGAQNTVGLYLVNQGWSGDTNMVELRVVQFSEIAGFQINIREAGANGQFLGIDQVNLPNFSNSNYSFNNNRLSLLWYAVNGEGITLPDGAVLVRLLWLSDPSKRHCYQFTGSPIPIEIIDSRGSPLTVQVSSSCEPFTQIPSFFNVYRDLNQNCTYDLNEPIYDDFIVQDSFKGNVKTYKNPKFLVYNASEFGIHHYTLKSKSPSWVVCNSGYNLNVDSSLSLISLNFGISPLLNCPQLEVEISSPPIQRCVDYSYQINYINKGTVAEPNAMIRITLDSFMEFQAASKPVSFVNWPYLDFRIGQLDPLESGSFRVIVNINCNLAELGQTHCLKAEILPVNYCQISPLWSGASVVLSGTCQDNKVKFRIQNSGQQNMTEPISYWIVEDDIMPGLKKNIQLNSGQFLDLEYPANGKTYRLLADQVRFHPGMSHPTVALEGCGRNVGGTFSKGYYLMFAEDDEDGHVAYDCQETREPLQPNEKMGWPKGYGPEFYVNADQSIKYRIRFQNTGSDTVHKVTIVDTLSPWVDFNTLEILGSSHPFHFNLVDRVLSFVFDPIYLPYQRIDESGSQGFVSYRVRPKGEVSLDTRIENTAQIYFDQNRPIKTNTTIHTLSKDFIVVSTEPPADPEHSLMSIYPNPNSGTFQLSIRGLKPGALFRLYDLESRLCLSRILEAEETTFNLREHLCPGMYLMRVDEGNHHTHAARIWFMD